MIIDILKMREMQMCARCKLKQNLYTVYLSTGLISFKKMIRYERPIEIFKTISYVVFQDQSLEASQISICDKKWRR